MKPKVHMLQECMTGVLPLSWALCGRMVSDWLATGRRSQVTCPKCKRAMERDRKRAAERKGGKA